MKRIETLSELCRKLQVKNKDLSDDLKMAKTNLFNQGISLQFKSDIKETPKPRNEPRLRPQSPLKAKAADVTDDGEGKKNEEGEENENERDEEDDTPNGTVMNGGGAPSVDNDGSNDEGSCRSGLKMV